MKFYDLLISLLAEVETDPDLWDWIVDYARGRGGITMEEFCRHRDPCFRQMVADQDAISWR